jgi:putative transcriptional regulator
MTTGAIRSLIAALALFSVILYSPALGQDIQPDRALYFASLSPADKSQGAVRTLQPEVRKLAKGIFLVATDRIQDRLFGRSVILLIAHNQNGSMGLIINKPTDVRIADLLPDIKGLAKAPDTLYLGGPVLLDAFFLLVRMGKKTDKSEHIFANIYLSQSQALLKRIADHRQRGENFRFFAGHAGWTAGQLESEVIRGDWLVIPADPEIVFDKDPAGIWDRLMPRKISI